MSKRHQKVTKDGLEKLRSKVDVSIIGFFYTFLLLIQKKTQIFSFFNELFYSKRNITL